MRPGESNSKRRVSRLWMNLTGRIRNKIMYGHEVITDLEKATSLTSSVPEHGQTYIDALQATIPMIRRSFHFHTDEANTIAEGFKEFTGKPLFMEKAGCLRLPHPLCWIDYKYDYRKTGKPLDPGTVECPRRAILAVEFKFKDGQYGIQAILFTYTKEIGHWIMELQTYFINVGRFIDKDHPLMEIRREMSKLTNTPIKEATNPTGNIYPWPLMPFTSEVSSKITEEANSDLGHLQNTLLLLNDKNIATQRILPSIQLNKRRIKQGKQPRFPYQFVKANALGIRD